MKLFKNLNTNEFILANSLGAAFHLCGGDTVQEVPAIKSPPAMDIPELLAWLAARYDYSYEDLVRHNQERQVCFVRSLAVVLLRDHYQMSFNEMARVFNNRHNRTMRWIYVKAKEQLNRESPNPETLNFKEHWRQLYDYFLYT